MNVTIKIPILSTNEELVFKQNGDYWIVSVMEHETTLKAVGSIMREDCRWLVEKVKNDD